MTIFEENKRSSFWGLFGNSLLSLDYLKGTKNDIFFSLLVLLDLVGQVFNQSGYMQKLEIDNQYIGIFAKYVIKELHNSAKYGSLKSELLVCKRVYRRPKLYHTKIMTTSVSLRCTVKQKSIFRNNQFMYVQSRILKVNIDFRIQTCYIYLQMYVYINHLFLQQELRGFLEFQFHLHQNLDMHRL